MGNECVDGRRKKAHPQIVIQNAANAVLENEGNVFCMDTSGSFSDPLLHPEAPQPTLNADSYSERTLQDNRYCTL